MDPRLIYDVGMHNGDDTAYYLARGYRVVAVEADPTLIADARRRFDTEIRDGRLALVHAAVGDSDGTAEFWVCPEHRAGNSFTRSSAERFGRPVERAEVPVRRFAGILAEHGVPFYLKIDIEGFDGACIAAIGAADRPRYLSWEMSTLDDLVLARAKGYNAFKCVSQVTFRPYEIGDRRGRRRVTATARLARLRAAAARYIPAVAAPAGPGPRSIAWPGGSWRFPEGSSGPFGEDLPGPWKALEEVAYDYLDFWLYTGRHAGLGTREWFDIHATTLEGAAAPSVGDAVAD